MQKVMKNKFMHYIVISYHMHESYRTETSLKASDMSDNKTYLYSTGEKAKL
jgi:hypothetical protein